MYTVICQIDDKTRAMVKEYVAKKRTEKNLPPETLAADELPADEDNVADDEEVRQKIQSLIEKDAPDLMPIEGAHYFCCAYSNECVAWKILSFAF